MHSFIDTIFRYLSKALGPVLLTALFGGVLLFRYCEKRREQGRPISKKQAAAMLLLMCYLGGLVTVTLLLRMGGSGRVPIQTCFLRAFWDAWNAFTLQVWLNPLLNIAMFIPLGVLLPLALPRFQRWHQMLAAGLGTSLLVEALQFFTGRGQADVDDLFCNTLGAMLGYCLYRIVLSFFQREWKALGLSTLLPILSAAVLLGIFTAYRLQPYGNLADGPIPAAPADTSQTEWVLDCRLSGDPGPAGVYWAAPFTKESCDAFAVSFLSQVGASIDFARDVDYYDNTTYYSDHHTFFLLVNHNDRSYEYTDYRVDSELRHSGKGGTITEEELRSQLDKLGVAVPRAARLFDEGKGRYVFRVSNAEEGGAFYDGELDCRVAEDGVLYQVDNAMSAAALYGEAPVISELEAYDCLRAGRFDSIHTYSFSECASAEVHVVACDLEYLTDSKGFRQPVYYFTLSDDQDESLRGGRPWRVFVPALA